MSDTLYIQTKENVEVHHPHVYLQDIAKLSCTNSKILNHLRVLPVANLDPDKTGRYCQYCYKMVQSHICLPRHLFRCRLFHYDL